MYQTIRSNSKLIVKIGQYISKYSIFHEFLDTSLVFLSLTSGTQVYMPFAPFPT